VVFTTAVRDNFRRAGFRAPDRTGPRGRIIRMGPFLLRAALTGLAMWIVTLFMHGMRFVGGNTTLQTVAIIFVVAVIFGLVNAFIKPIVQILSIPLYIVTLGLIHIVINALMLWITAWITSHTTHWGLQIDHFWWTAIWAAILLSIVSWVLSLVIRDVTRA
jgi:putative membrane protein